MSRPDYLGPMTPECYGLHSEGGACVHCMPRMFPNAGLVLREPLPPAVTEKPLRLAEARIERRNRRESAFAGGRLRVIRPEEYTLLRMLRAKAKQMGVSIATLSNATRLQVEGEIERFSKGKVS